ncbi:MAG: alginate lyase family protein [Filomicrobium sp.]
MSSAFACAPAPAPIHNLNLQRYYSDAKGIRIDTAKRRELRAAVAPLKSFMVETAQQTDAVWRGSEPDVARAKCVLAWLEAWARADALLGKMSTKQAKYERNWALSGLALSYLKVRPFVPVTQHEVISRWLLKLANLNRAFLNESGRKRNNHRYWLGLGLGAVGLATDDERAWSDARAIMAEAAQSITANGTLPLELARGKRAVHYHNFAAQPLFVLIALARARGEDWSALNDGAFGRLVGFLADALCAPRSVPELQVLPAQVPVNPRDFQAGWINDYVARGGKVDACLEGIPREKRATNYHRLGGDFGQLSKALAAKRF